MRPPPSCFCHASLYFPTVNHACHFVPPSVLRRTRNCGSDRWVKPVNCYSRRGCFHARREESRARAVVFKTKKKKRRGKREGGSKKTWWIHTSVYTACVLLRFFCSSPARVSFCWSMPSRLSDHANSTTLDWPVLFSFFLFVQLTTTLLTAVHPATVSVVLKRARHARSLFPRMRTSRNRRPRAR